MTAAFCLCLAFLLPAGSIVRDIIRTPRDGAWTPRPKRQYEAPYRQPGPDLPHRPEGNAALKAEIAQIPAGYVPARPVSLHTRKDHDDWRFKTGEWEIARELFFADQPDDQAVQRVWAGAGR